MFHGSKRYKVPRLEASLSYYNAFLRRKSKIWQTGAFRPVERDFTSRILSKSRCIPITIIQCFLKLMYRQSLPCWKLGSRPYQPPSGQAWSVRPSSLLYIRILFAHPQSFLLLRILLLKESSKPESHLPQCLLILFSSHVLLLRSFHSGINFKENTFVSFVSKRKVCFSVVQSDKCIARIPSREKQVRFISNWPGGIFGQTLQ